MKPIIYWLLVFIVVLVNTELMAQKVTNEQLWFDSQFAVSFANSYVFDTEVSYQTLLSNQDKWRCFQLTPTIQRNLSPKFDASFSTLFSFTHQSSSYNTFETRFTPALKYIISANGRIESRAGLKYDLRYLNSEGQELQTSSRVRLSLEFLIPINKKTYYEDNLYYAIVDAELFYVVDENLKERYANLRKARLGLGYRLNYRNRFEAIYQFHESRTTIDQPYDTQDNIFRLRYIKFLNGGEKSPASEN